MKVAIVCDWLVGIGGSERVVLNIHQLYPEAPIFTSQYDPENMPWFNDADVRTGWLQKVPTKLRKFLPLLRAYYFSRLNLNDYELVISVTGAEAKGVKTGPNTIHICYCNSPTQYYWIRQDEYLKQPGFPRGFNWLAKLALRVLDTPMKRWDKHAARQPDYIITNSNYSKGNIKRFYNRDATVIYPPVDVDRFKLKANPPSRHGLLIAGRQTPYKQMDLAIEACNNLKIPLIVIGNGPDHKRLVRLAGRTITFLIDVNDLQMTDHFQSSIAFIFPSADDFGIVAVEALAAGTPVIAYKKGGALDYIIEGKNGVFFDRHTVSNLSSAIENALNKKFNYQQISESAQQFKASRFREEFKDYVIKVTSETH